MCSAEGHRLRGVLLVLERNGEPCDLGSRGVEQTGGLGRQALEGAGQLGQEDLARLELGELGEEVRAREEALCQKRGLAAARQNAWSNSMPLGTC